MKKSKKHKNMVDSTRNARELDQDHGHQDIQAIAEQLRATNEAILVLNKCKCKCILLHILIR